MTQRPTLTEEAQALELTLLRMGFSITSHMSDVVSPSHYYIHVRNQNSQSIGIGLSTVDYSTAMKDAFDQAMDPSCKSCGEGT